MPHDGERFGVFVGDQLERDGGVEWQAGSLHYGFGDGTHGIDDRAIHFRRERCIRESFANCLGHVDRGIGFGILLHTAVGKLNLKHGTL